MTFMSPIAACHLQPAARSDVRAQDGPSISTRYFSQPALPPQKTSNFSGFIPHPFRHPFHTPEAIEPIRTCSSQMFPNQPGLGGTRTRCPSSFLGFQPGAMLNMAVRCTYPLPTFALPAGWRIKPRGGAHRAGPCGFAVAVLLEPRRGVRQIPLRQAHGIWELRTRQGRKAATVVCSAPAVVTLALFFTRSRAGTGPREPSAGRGLPRARRGGKSLRSCLIKS